MTQQKYYYLSLNVKRFLAVYFGITNKLSNEWRKKGKISRMG